MATGRLSRSANLTRLRGSGPEHAVTRHDQRVPSVAQNVRHLLHLLRRRNGRRGALHSQRSFVLDLGLGNVLRKVDEAHPRLLRLGLLERLTNHLGNNLRGAKLAAVLGDRVEQRHQIQVLVALLVHARRRCLSGDGDQGSSIHVGVGNAGDQVGGTGSEGRQANSGLAGESPTDVGHEGRTLLMACGDEVDRAVEERIHDVDVLLARNPEDGLDPFVFETPDEELRGLHSGRYMGR